MLWSEDSSVIISKIACQSCCLSLIDHFFGVKINGNPVYLPEMLFFSICKSESAVLLEFNMLRCEDNSVSFPISRNARHDSELRFELSIMNLLASKGNGNRDLYFIIIRTCGISFCNAD